MGEMNENQMKEYEALQFRVKEQKRKQLIATHKFLKKNRDLVNERRREAHKKKRQEELRRREENEQMKIEDIDVKLNETKKIIDLSFIRDQLIKLKKEGIIKTDNTLKKYEEDTKRLMDMTGCDDLKKCLLKHEEIIKGIENSTMRNGKPYSLNTKKGIYQTIIYLLDNIKKLKTFNKKIRQIYFTKWELYKISSRDETDTKISNDKTMNYDDYVNKVKDKYGEKSKEFLIVSLYDEITARDDFGQLKLLPMNMSKETFKGENVLFYGKKKFRIQMNKFKTYKEDKQVKIELSEGLSKLMREYIKTHDLKEGDNLFREPKNKLGEFLKKMNKALNVNDKGGSVNYIRHSKITTEYSKEKLTPEDRLRLSKLSQHSPITQLRYIRQLEIVPK